MSLLLAPYVAALQSPNASKRYLSPSHFSVSYPIGWIKRTSSTDRLILHSSAGGAEGVGIKPGQAEIIVMEAPASSTQTLEQLITTYTQGTSVLSRRRLLGTSDPHGCSSISEVISKEPVVPPEDTPLSVPVIVNTDLFCEVDGRSFVVLLRNWEGDKTEAAYQQVAVQIAKGIRTTT